MAKGGIVITELNRLIEFVEVHLSDDLDVAALASTLGTTEYHLRRMFSSLGERGRIAPGTMLPAPQAVFPRYIEPAVT